MNVNVDATAGGWTTEQVSAALNKAADNVGELGSDATRDAINLVVNAAMSYLEGEATDLRGVIAANYSADTNEVLSWLS